MGAVQINGRIIAGAAQLGDQPLAFAERVAADDMGAFGEEV